MRSAQSLCFCCRSPSIARICFTIESRFINFPDEGHWVLKPKNSEYWHKEVFGWLKKHVPPGGK